jgi:hypothetical protein
MSLKNLAYKVAKPITKKILSLRNIHDGESCYIFGDGVSIKSIDLKHLPKRTSIIMAFLFLHKDACSIDIKYALNTEPWYFYPFIRMPDWSKDKKWFKNDINQLFFEYFLHNSDVSCFVNLSNYFAIRGENIFHLFRKIDDPSFLFQNELIKSGINPYAGSINTSILLASYLGFKDIILVGCDYTHGNQARVLHWYEKGQGYLLNNSNQYYYESKFFKIAQKYVKLQTLTLLPVSSFLPHLVYSDFTGYDPNFKENHEIVDLKALKLLETWPGYNIF